MAVTIVSFRWLEILEKEFDKNFVDLDLLIGDLDGEEPDFVYSARQKLAGLSSCFAQLTHKAQTVFQNSAKIEAELVDLRTELVNSKTRQEILEEESRSLVLQLHSLQLDRLPSNQNPEQYKEKIETALKLSPSKNSYSEEITFRNNSEIKKLKNELHQYQGENAILRNSILALHSEVYGARLAAKYLDKELAGRIQQLQLLGKEMRTDIKDKLWRQLESEILLHRHKTVIRACRNRTNHDFIQRDSRILNFTQSGQRFIGDDFDAGPLVNFDPNRTGDGIFFNKSSPRYRSPSEESKPNDGEEDGNKLADLMGESPAKKETGSVEDGGSSSDELNVDNVNKKSKESDITLIRLESSEVDKRVEEIEKTDDEKMEKELMAPGDGKGGGKKSSNPGVEEDFSCVIGEKRTVMVRRQSGQGLGISITGGREHGVPILISELEVGGPAYECRNLYVGDAILKVNDISLENASHFEAVKILTNLETNDVKLLVQFIAVDTDEENSLSEDLYGYRYRFFDTEVMDSSDALGLHPVHANSAHTPTAPRTPDYCRRGDGSQVIRIQHSKQSCDDYYALPSPFKEFSPLKKEDGMEEKPQKLIDIDTDPKKPNREPLKIDLFGFHFQTDMNDVMSYESSDPLDDFIIKEEKRAETEIGMDLIEIDGTSKMDKSESKYKYVDENIFSGLEDNSILDNIVKSFSEDDFSYLENDKDKNATSDSGLEIYLSGSDLDGDKRHIEDRCKDKTYLSDWMDNTPEKIELKTLHQIFDRSFSSNLSSPRGSTSFDDDILSTEHSDEKSNLANNVRNKMKDMKNTYNPKKIQKFYPKNMDMSEDALRKSFKSESVAFIMKNEALASKKTKRNSSDTLKRGKNSRKGKEGGRKESVKAEKRKNSKEPDVESYKQGESGKKRETNYKMTDRFDENLIEYNVKNYEIEEAPREKGEDVEEAEEGATDELEETRKLSRKYGLKIPGKVVKTEVNNRIVFNEMKSPEKCIKILESHFKHFKPALNANVKHPEKDNNKPKVSKSSRYDSFGDPDFGTPV